MIQTLYLVFLQEGGLLYVEVDPSAGGAENWKLDQVVGVLKEGAVGVIPTDTVQVFLCHLIDTGYYYYYYYFLGTKGNILSYIISPEELVLKFHLLAYTIGKG